MVEETKKSKKSDCHVTPRFTAVCENNVNSLVSEPAVVGIQRNSLI